MDREMNFPYDSNQYYENIPSSVKGRLTSEDYISFDWDETINASDYDVVVESLNGNFRPIGVLKKDVKLPVVMYFPDSLLLILPKTNNNSIPKFVGTLERGKTYFVTKKSPLKNGFYLLK